MKIRRPTPKAKNIYKAARSLGEAASFACSLNQYLANLKSNIDRNFYWKLLKCGTVYFDFTQLYDITTLLIHL